MKCTVWVRSSLVTLTFYLAIGGIMKVIQSQMKQPTARYTCTITWLSKANPLLKGRTVMHFWVKGDKWKKEEVLGEIRRITIVAGGWSYFLIPETKTGMKTKMKEREEPYPNPFNWLGEWKKKGAKRVGREILNGQECEIYEKFPSEKDPTRAKIWARKKDGLVLRVVEDKEKDWFMGQFSTAVYEFKDIKVGVPIPNSLFVVPKGYKLEER